MKTDDVGTLNQETLKRIILETIRDNPNEFGRAFNADHIEANTTLKVGGQSLSGFITGQVDSSGSILAGSGFTVNRSATGIYDITFNSSFGTVPTVQVSAGPAASIRACVVDSTSTTTFRVDTFNFGGTPTNATFSFVAFATN